MRPFFAIPAFKGPLSTNIQAFAASLSQIIMLIEGKSIWDSTLRISLRNLRIACLSTRGVDMFDEAMQTIIEQSSRSVSLVSAASLWLLYVLALTCLFVCCLGQVVPTRDLGVVDLFSL